MTRVLVVDDQQAVRTALVVVLELHGISCLEASTPGDAPGLGAGDAPTLSTGDGDAIGAASCPTSGPATTPTPTTAAVARAAIETGVAQLDIDPKEIEARCRDLVYEGSRS